MAGVIADPRTRRASGLIMVFSVLLLVEGVTRVNLNINTGEPWRGTHTVFPPIVGLLGGLTEVIFAFTGLVVGYFHLVHGIAHKMVVLMTLGLQILFGWFTFAVYSLAEPSFQAARTTTPDPNLSLRATRAVIIMGLLGVATQCAALQGGQFMFTFLLYGYTSGSGKPQTGMLFRGRMMFFSFLIILKGVSEITIGSIVYTAYGDGELAKPVVSIPYVVTKPGLLIAGGTWVTLTGLIGLMIAVANMRQAGVHFSILAFFAFLVVIGLDDLGSVGIAPPAIVVGSLQVGLGFAEFFMAAYSGAFLNGEEPITIEDKANGVHMEENGKHNQPAGATV